MLEPVERFLNYIGGEHRPARSGRWLDTVNPATGQVWAQVPASGAEDVDDAVAAARHAYQTSDWRRVPAMVRAARLRAWADAVDAAADQLAKVETTDNGRPWRDTRHVLLPGAAMQIRYLAGLGETIEGSTVELRPDVLTYTAYEPAGVTAIIVPWNGPLPVFVAKVAATLAAGNAVVVKPPKEAAASILEATRLFDSLDIPRGLVNVVCGSGATVGDAIAGHPGITRISLTGSTGTGRRLMQQGAGTIKRLLLELGGKSPNIVFADADLEAAASGAAAGIFTPNAGQSCVAGSRILVEASIAEEFTARLAKHAESLVLGDPMDMQTGMGPLANKAQFETVRSYVTAGLEEGARLVSGGRSGPELFDQGSPFAAGYFAEPTLFATADNSLRICQEEIFGPVAVVLPFRGEEEAVRIANDSPYGLTAGVWTEDLRRAHRMVRSLQAGTVWVNMYKAMHWAMPFGGVKQSGNGTANGSHEVRDWMIPKSVWMRFG
jgi:aldehyde dehydrogenase (NAD+)